MKVSFLFSTDCQKGYQLEKAWLGYSSGTTKSLKVNHFYDGV